MQSDAVNEAAALREGEYVAVRRFTRLLEGGPEAKAALDQVLLFTQGCMHRIARAGARQHDSC